MRCLDIQMEKLRPKYVPGEQPQTLEIHFQTSSLLIATATSNKIMMERESCTTPVPEIQIAQLI